jgi:uncharacterized protein YndB with AHSA1/START domain
MDPAIIHSTFVIERTYPKPPEQVFAAFSDPAKKRRWFGAGENHEVEEFELDFRPGGAERLVYRFKEGTPFPGVAVSNQGIVWDIVPNRRIVNSHTMAIGGRPISASLLTFEFLPKGQGTDLICTHQGVFFENSDGPQIREAGWRTLLEKLSQDFAQ